MMTSSSRRDIRGYLPRIIPEACSRKPAAFLMPRPGEHHDEPIGAQGARRPRAPGFERRRRGGFRSRIAPEIDDTPPGIDRCFEIPTIALDRAALEIARADRALTKPLEQRPHLRHRAVERSLRGADVDDE